MNNEFGTAKSCLAKNNDIDTYTYTYIYIYMLIRKPGYERLARDCKNFEFMK